jgi:hypothetical protein
MAFGLGSAAANAVGMAGDEPVRIVVPAAAPPPGLGSVASGELEQAQAEWRDEQWRQQQAQPKRRARGVLYDPESPEAKQQDALNASIRAEQAKGTMGLGSVAAGQGPSALQSAMGEREGELSGIYGALATPMRQVAVDNWRRPFAEQDAQTFHGGGQLQLQPFEPPPPEAGEDEWSYMARVQQLQAEDEQRQIAEAGQVGDVRDIGKSGHLGMGEAQLQAAENVGAAELQQAERVAEVQRQAAEMSSRATEEARVARQEAIDAAAMQREAVGQAQAVQADARERLQALPELDPNRTFKSMEGGGLFWAIIGSLAGGAIGQDVSAKLIDIANRDLDAQKANAAQAFDQFGAATSNVDQQANLYRQLQQSVGEAADPMWLQIQLEDAERMLRTQLAETTVAKHQAELQQSLVGVRQQIDAQQRAVDVQLATTPEKIVKTFDPLGRRTRDLLMKRAERIEGERFKLQMAGIEGEEKALDREGRIKEKQADVGTQRSTQAQQLAATHAKEVAKMQAASSLLKDFVSKARRGDVAGRGLDTYFATEEGRGVREALKEAQRRQLRYESQGVIGEDELEDRVDSMLSGWGDNELLSNAERLINANAKELEEREYGLSEEARQIYYRNPDLAPLPARGAGRPSGGADADAAALGGKVVR